MTTPVETASAASLASIISSFVIPSGSPTVAIVEGNEGAAAADGSYSVPAGLTGLLGKSGSSVIGGVGMGGFGMGGW